MFQIFQPELFLPHLIVILIIVGIILPIHEFAHAYAAYKLGDPTAKYEGRLTLNPLAHLDLYGTILLVLAGIGWGKPVPVNPYNLKHRHGETIVSLAGPLSNLLLAFVLVIVSAFLPEYLRTFGVFNLNTLILTIIRFSVLLGVFNLIPIPPLDGSKILFDLLPSSYNNFKRNLESYGPIILLLFFFTQINGGIFFTFVDSLTRLFIALADWIHKVIY